MLYHPEESIAYLGDLLFIGFQPYLADGDPEELLRILDKIESLDPKMLVPGHGRVGTSRESCAWISARLTVFERT